MLGLLLASLALATVAAVVLLPVSARFAAALVAVLLIGVLAYPASRWALALAGLQPLRLESLEGVAGIRSATLEAVGRRAELQSLASARGEGGEPTRARQVLGRYLACHPVGNGMDGRVWLGLGLTEEVRSGLKHRKDELLALRRPGTAGGWPPGEWLRSFEEGFQAPLDVSAERRVRDHAWRTFVATAASPNVVFDTLVTLSAGSSMLIDLGRIYDLRVGRVGGAVLLIRLLVDSDLAHCANRPDAWSEPVIQRAAGEGGAIDEIGRESGFRGVLERHPIPSDTTEIEALLPKGASEFGLRAESGLLHYFLMRRLGARAIRLLQPTARR
jgi:hypothetical protein